MSSRQAQQKKSDDDFENDFLSWKPGSMKVDLNLDFDDEPPPSTSNKDFGMSKLDMDIDFDGGFSKLMSFDIDMSSFGGEPVAAKESSVKKSPKKGVARTSPPRERNTEDADMVFDDTPKAGNEKVEPEDVMDATMTNYDFSLDKYDFGVPEQGEAAAAANEARIIPQASARTDEPWIMPQASAGTDESRIIPEDIQHDSEGLVDRSRETSETPSQAERSLSKEFGISDTVAIPESRGKESDGSAPLPGPLSGAARPACSPAAFSSPDATAPITKAPSMTNSMFVRDTMKKLRLKEGETILKSIRSQKTAVGTPGLNKLRGKLISVCAGPDTTVANTKVTLQLSSISLVPENKGYQQSRLFSAALGGKAALQLETGPQEREVKDTPRQKSLRDPQRGKRKGSPTVTTAGVKEPEANKTLGADKLQQRPDSMPQESVADVVFDKTKASERNLRGPEITTRISKPVLPPLKEPAKATGLPIGTPKQLVVRDKEKASSGRPSYYTRLQERRAAQLEAQRTSGGLTKQASPKKNSKSKDRPAGRPEAEIPGDANDMQDFKCSVQSSPKHVLSMKPSIKTEPEVLHPTPVEQQLQDNSPQSTSVGTEAIEADDQAAQDPHESEALGVAAHGSLDYTVEGEHDSQSMLVALCTQTADQADKFSQELNQIEKTLRKKHDEVKDLLVRACVLNSSLLMLNNPMDELKISFEFYVHSGPLQLSFPIISLSCLTSVKLGKLKTTS